MKRSVMDRIIDRIEAIAAVFVGLVAADIFISVLLRDFFASQIPDSYDFGSMLLGILIFWGIAATSYRGTHITVDLVWAAAGHALEAADRHLRHAGAAVRGQRADRDAVRQGARDLPRQRADLRPASADLAVLRQWRGSATFGRAADRDPHVPADLPSGGLIDAHPRIRPVE